MALREEEWCRRHVRFLRLHLRSLSHHYLSLDTSRVTLLYFCIVGLDGLGALETTVTEEERQQIIDWVYALQVVDEATGRGGFRGGTWSGQVFEGAEKNEYDGPHVAMTYTALAVLLTLGDDLSGVKKKAVAREIAALQQPDGSFSAVADGSERDARFAYCACAATRLLRDHGGDEKPLFDLKRLLSHLEACRGYDGGYGLTPQSEAHGGATYCCVASLILSDDRALDDDEEIVR